MGLLRSTVIIGLIALASPVHQEQGGAEIATLRDMAGTMAAEPATGWREGLTREALSALARADQRTLSEAAQALAALEAMREGVAKR